MKIKKYEAVNMKEALRLIKDDLGPDAVILSTRKVMKNNNFGLFARPVLEVTAASDYKGQPIKKAPSKPSPSTPYGGYASAASSFSDKHDEPFSASASYKDRRHKAYQDEPLLDDTEPYYEGNTFAKYPAEPVYKPVKNKQPAINYDLHDNPAADREKLAELLDSCGLNKFNELIKDIGEIKKQISDMKAGMADNMVVDLSPQLKTFLNLFIKNGVDNVIAYRFLKRVEKRIASETSGGKIRELIVDMLADIIAIAPDYSALLHKRIVALAGPTGVGKTTTIAKIAAALTLKHKRRVCLITVDNFRIGAVEQLKTYAEIVNIPLYVATSAAEFQRIIAEVRDKYDCILVDSMGRSQFDSKQIKEIGDMLTTNIEINVALVLSLAANHKELVDTLDKYSPLSPDYLIFTKLDETKYFGPLINLPVMKNIPLLLVTTGQNVPDDMEIPNGKKIAKKVLQEIPSLWSVK